MADLLDRIRTAVASQYRVDRELGHGGMATVFLAEDLKHHRPVAIKVLDPQLADMLGPERFTREIETAAGLQNPHILTLLDSGSAGGLLYYVMPFVEGQSLRARLDAERQLGQAEAVRLAIEIARALDSAHRRGMVHRDIKPENVLLADGQAMVADFGIARAIRAAGGDRLTQTGVTLGSPPYMSPEQIAGNRDLDGRSDIYSLGCVLYEMLAGQPPFTGAPESLAHQHLNLAPRSVRDLRTTVSPALDAVVARSLAKSPADRFASAAEMVAALSEVDTGSRTAAQPVPSVIAMPRSPGRRWVAVVVAAAVLTIAGIILWRTGVIGGKGRPAEGERRWVWVADFEGPPSDPALASAARELVAGALDQSKILAAVPREQVRIALHNSGRPDSIPVPPDLARELAFRSAIPVVLEGGIGRLGSRYSIVLRATHARDGTVIQTANGDAASERDLVPALTRLARVIRQALGERAEAFRETGSWADSPTPSFEAFKLALQGRDLVNANDPQAAVTAYRRALELDPGFATAWIGVGTAYGNMGLDDSARVVLERALRMPDRLTPARRLDAEAKLAAIRDDLQAQIDAYDALLRLDPSPADRAMAINNKAVALAEAGLHDAALDLYRQALRAWPVEAPPLNVGNVIDQLIALNRLDEARAGLVGMTGPRSESLTMTLAAIEDDWDRLDTLATARLADPSTRITPRRVARLSRVAVQAMRGSMENASRQLSEIAALADSEGDPNYIGMIWTYRDWAAQLMGRESPRMPAGMLGTPWEWTGRATLAARAGDSTAARRALQQWPAAFKPRARAMVVDYIAGTIAWKRGRWHAAVERLRTHARGGIRFQPSAEELARAQSRWMIADCYARLQQPDSAAAYLELLLTPPQNAQGAIWSRALCAPYVRSRLVALYAGQGRLDHAERHWEILSSTCTRPDPAISAMLDETRATLQTARGMRAARP